jgi:DNA-binding transcriptional LysR family regulator
MDLLEAMATYVRVVEAGSLAAAARQLRITAGAVSRQMTMLEEELRVPLLVRSTRRMVITAAGQRYYERCLRVLRDVEEAQAVGRAEVLDGPLVVSTPVTLGLTRVAPHLPSLMKQHPLLRVDLRLEDRVVDLAFEGVDVAIRVGSLPPDSTDLVAQRLFAFHRVVVASPEYLRQHGEPKTPEMLASHDALVYSVGPGGDIWSLRNGEHEVRVAVNAKFRANAPHALRELAVCSVGLTLLPEWFVAEELRHRALTRVLTDWHTAPVAVNAIHRTARRGSSRVRAFIAHLRAAYP